MMAIAAIFVTFFLFVILGLPIALSLVLGSVVPLSLFGNVPLFSLVQKMFTAIDSYSLLALPFFMIAGGLMDKGGVSRRLIDFAKSLVGWMPGGLAVVTFVASAFFGAICGSASATVVAIGSITIPAMLREKYPLPFVLATSASAGWLGIVIPPSIPMVLYGISGNVSVGSVFMGGFIPGIALTFAMSLYAIWYGKKHLSDNLIKFSLREVGRTFVGAIGALIMPVIILGGIYGGVFSPTEAAAVACLYGIIIGMFIYKELSFKDLVRVFRNSIQTSSMILFIIATASAFAHVMTLEKIPQTIGTFITSVADTRFEFLLVVTLILFVVGCVMETSPAILILTPILVPLLSNYNISPVAFGVVMIINLGIGIVTPPVGVNLYVAASLVNAKVEQVINRHLLAYIILSVIVLIVLMAFPQIIMILPNLMV